MESVNTIEIGGNDDVKVVRREQWGAIPTESREPLKTPVDTVVLSYNTEMDVCSDVDGCRDAMVALQNRHIEMGELDIAYNFMMCGDGRMYEGRGWAKAPSSSLHFPLYYGSTVVIGMFGPRKEDQEDAERVDSNVHEETSEGEGYLDPDTFKFPDGIDEDEEGDKADYGVTAGPDLMIPALKFIRKAHEEEYIKDPLNVYEDHLDHFASNTF